jgi:hypothetical protein
LYDYMVRLSGLYASMGIVDFTFPVKVWCSRDDHADEKSFYIYTRAEDEGEEESEGVPRLIEATVQAVASQYFETDVVFDHCIMRVSDGNSVHRWKVTEVPLVAEKEDSPPVKHELAQKHKALQYGLSPQQLDIVFPFHIVFDSSLNIVQCGEQCLRLISASMVGSKITDIFDLHSESEQYSLTWGQIQSKLKGEESPVCDVLSDFCLTTTLQRTPLGHPLGLIGELSCSQREGVAVFLAYPDVSSLARMQDLGVLLQDLSKSDKLQLRSDALSDTLHGIKILEGDHSAVSNLQKALTVAEDKLSTKQKFVRYVSHEIRTPLMVVSIGLLLLQKDLKHVLTLQEAELLDSKDESSSPSSLSSSSSTLKGQSKSPSNADTKGVPHNTDHKGDADADADGDADDCDLNEIITKSLNTVEDCKNSMDVAIGILNDLLAYEKIEAGIFQLHETPVLACRFFKDTISEFNLQVTPPALSNFFIL